MFHINTNIYVDKPIANANVTFVYVQLSPIFALH